MAIRACHVARSQTCRKTPFRANIPMLRKDVSRTHFLRCAALRQTHEPIRVPRSRELSGDPDTRQGAVQYETVVVTADGQKERLKNAGILPCSPVGRWKGPVLSDAATGFARASSQKCGLQKAVAFLSARKCMLTAASEDVPLFMLIC